MPAWRPCDPSGISLQVLRCNKTVLTAARLHKTQRQLGVIFGCAGQILRITRIDCSHIEIMRLFGDPLSGDGGSPKSRCTAADIMPNGFAMATTWTDDSIEIGAAAPVGVRVYGKRQRGGTPPLVLHLHAGAFVGGTLESGQLVASLLAEAGAIVVSADYPLAPAHIFPGALRATLAVLNALHENRARWAARKSQIFVAGEEAGGNLAAGLALLARDRHPGLLAGQILISPMLDPLMGTCSIRSADAGPVGC